jgi:hypothetical protein
VLMGRQAHLTMVVVVEEVYGYTLTSLRDMVLSGQMADWVQVLGAEVPVVGLPYTFRRMKLSLTSRTAHTVEWVDQIPRPEGRELCFSITYTMNTVHS